MNMVYFACIYPQELPNFVDNYSDWDPTLTNMHHFVMMYCEYVYNITILQGFPDHETTVKTYIFFLSNIQQNAWDDGTFTAVDSIAYAKSPAWLPFCFACILLSYPLRFGRLVGFEQLWL